MVINSNEMNEIENSIQDMGLTKLELMENAGMQVSKIIEDKYKDKIKDQKILIICGQGNNGGDGFVTARYLFDVCKVKVLFIGEKELLSNEASVNYDCLNDLSLDIIMKYEEETSPFINFNDYDVIIDGMLGIGIKGELRHPYSSLIKLINRTKAFKVSIDIPTGLDPDKKDIDFDEAFYFEPDLVITFHDTKPVLESKLFKDKVQIVDIGIPF
jgi:ADP-dependent NAD(P)H-hydrate dehydratase / NAD(P)H-hydrate epimerase